MNEDEGEPLHPKTYESRNSLKNKQKYTAINMPDKNSNNNNNKQTNPNIMQQPNSPGSQAESQNACNDERNWPGETQTFVSATTDMSHFSNENLARFPKDRFSKIKCDSQFFSTLLISFISYSSPILFLLIPVIKGGETGGCNAQNPNCQTNILSIILKMGILSISSYWLFWQKSRVQYPRAHWPRLLSLGLMLLITGIYWLFYAVKILDRSPKVSMDAAVTFSLRLVDTLLYIHVLSIIVLELRLNSKNSDKCYLVEVIRSTDGEQRFYNIGKVTIQESAFLILTEFYKDFSLNNPASLLLGSLSSKRKMLKGMNDSTTATNTQANMNLSNKDFKIYNIDGNSSKNELGANAVEQSKQALEAAVARKKAGNQNANERYYEQLEWERHCRKRKCRLERLEVRRRR